VHLTYNSLTTSLHIDPFGRIIWIGHLLTYFFLFKVFFFFFFFFFFWNSWLIFCIWSAQYRLPCSQTWFWSKHIFLLIIYQLLFKMLTIAFILKMIFFKDMINEYWVSPATCILFIIAEVILAQSKYTFMNMLKKNTSFVFVSLFFLCFSFFISLNVTCGINCAVRSKKSIKTLRSNSKPIPWTCL